MASYYLLTLDYLQQLCSRLIFIAEQKAGQLAPFFPRHKLRPQKIVVHYFPTFTSTQTSG